MGIFDKLSGKKPENHFVQQVQAIAQELMDLYSKKVNTPFDKTSELERQILAVYLFGMADGLRQKEKLERTPLQIETDMTAVLMTIFRYSLPQAQEFVKGMISDLQSNDRNNTIYAIIHRGLDGYFAYCDGKKAEVVEDVSQIIKSLQTT
jgi:hypothetical protein